MKSMDKFIATGNGQKLQKTNLSAHAQQFKWNKFQLVLQKHPINFKELHRPPCVGDRAYTKEEQRWCNAIIDYLVTTLDVVGRQSCGIP